MVIDDEIKIKIRAYENSEAMSLAVSYLRTTKKLSRKIPGVSINLRTRKHKSRLKKP